MGKTETINPRRDENDRGAQLRRTTMLRKVTLALVAAASLSVMALAPSTASAGGVFWPKYPHHHHHWGPWPRLWHRLRRWRLWRLLRDPPRADAPRLPLADRERLLLIQRSSFGSGPGRATRPGILSRPCLPRADRGCGCRKGSSTIRPRTTEIARALRAAGRGNPATGGGQVGQKQPGSDPFPQPREAGRGQR